MKLSIYRDIIKEKHRAKIINKFYETLTITNRNYDYYVNWYKIASKIADYDSNIIDNLNELIGNRRFITTLREILSKNSEFISIIPTLIGTREESMNDSILEIAEDKTDLSKVVEYNFKNRKLDKKEIELFIGFFKKTGLKHFLQKELQSNAHDYILGIEAGLDSHARKSRSGDVMEFIVESMLENIINTPGELYSIYKQKQLKSIAEEYKLKLTNDVKNKKCDFLICRKEPKTIIDIETNYYCVQGSKPNEIVGSYVSRQENLKRNGVSFIWITDGQGVSKMKSEIKFAFSQIDFLMNLYFAKEGLLSKAIQYYMNKRS